MLQTLRHFLSRGKRRQAAREVRMELEKARRTHGPTIGMDLPVNDVEAVIIAEQAVRMFPDLIIVRTGSKLMLTFRGAFEAQYAAENREVLEKMRLVDQPALDDARRDCDLEERK